MLVDAGKDIQNVNSTIPLYSPRANEDPNIVLDYQVDLYAPGSSQMVKNWFVPLPFGFGSTTNVMSVGIVRVLRAPPY